MKTGNQNRPKTAGIRFALDYRAMQIIFAVLLALHLGACAGTQSVAKGNDTSALSAADPWETFNRGIDTVNRGLDRVTLKPAAQGYQKLLPAFVRRGATNFFSNLRTPLTIINQILQGKGRAAFSDTGRLLLNSTVGIGGLFDPATSTGLERHNEDFGQTLATWGVPDGPFVMLPLLGPRTLRDALAVPLNIFANPLLHYENTSARDKLWALQALDMRARLLSVESMIDDSYDPYVTVRDAYLQNRRYLIYDGDPPELEDEFLDEFFDEP
jgi:phospholipid-binding lipoprotein MlaA